MLRTFQMTLVLCLQVVNIVHCVNIPLYLLNFIALSYQSAIARINLEDLPVLLTDTAAQCLYDSFFFV